MISIPYEAHREDDKIVVKVFQPIVKEETCGNHDYIYLNIKHIIIV